MRHPANCGRRTTNTDVAVTVTYKEAKITRGALCQKYQNLWKFDGVLTNSFAQFFETRCNQCK